MEKTTAQKFDKVSKIYDSPLFQLYYFFAHRASIKFLNNCLKNNADFLDVACGTGIFINKIKKLYPKIRPFGIDNSEGMVALAKKRLNLGTLYVASAEKIPFTDNTFDIITIIDAFYYFQDKEAVLKECYRVLKPGGNLFIFYPAADILPKLLIGYIKFNSKIWLSNSEEYSSFPSKKDFERMAVSAHLQLIKKQIIFFHRFFIFKK